jgi:diguanylate cyclase (GGDEF)-like protein
MLKNFLSTLVCNKQKISDLDPDQQQKIASDIAITNWKRVRIFLSLTLLFEVLLIFFYDIPAIRSSTADELWLNRAYLILHLLIASAAITGIVLSIGFLGKSWKNKWGNEYLSVMVALIILVFLSVITGLDQIKTGEISVFVINLLVCSVLLLVPFRVSFILFTIPFGVFIIEIFTYQTNIATRNSHLINGGIFWVAVLVLSTFLYDNFVSHIQKNIKLEEANRKLEDANQKLLTLSLHDPLTHLPNRRNFELRIEQELAMVKRFNQRSWLILIDLDHFKNVNDRFGHVVGDRVLQETAAFLSHNIRDVDMVCRWGGEEFLLLITHTELDGIRFNSHRLCTSLAQTPMNVDGKLIPITASFGIAPLIPHGSDEDDFMTCYKLADQALYKAKQNGRNRVVITDQL